MRSNMSVHDLCRIPKILDQMNFKIIVGQIINSNVRTYFTINLIFRSCHILPNQQSAQKTQYSIEVMVTLFIYFNKKTVFIYLF